MLATNQSTIMSKEGSVSQILVGWLIPGSVLVTAYVKEKGKVIFIVQDADKKCDILSDLIPILEEYAAILKEIARLPPARGVENHIKLKFGSFPKHQINEGITDFGDIFVEETATEHDKSTLLMGFFIGRYSEISVISEERGKKQFGVRDMNNIGKESVLLVESREVLPLLETHVVIKRFDRVLQGWVEGIRSLLMFIAEVDAAFLCCKKQTSVQQLSKAALDGNFITEPLLTISTCVLTQAGKKIAHLLLHWLKVRPNSSIWKVEKFHHRKFPSFDPRGRGSFQGGGIVMYRKWVKKKGKSLRTKKEELGIEVAVNTEKGKKGKKARLEDESGRLRSGGLNLCYWAVLKDNWAIGVWASIIEVAH